MKDPLQPEAGADATNEMDLESWDAEGGAPGAGPARSQEPQETQEPPQETQEPQQTGPEHLPGSHPERLRTQVLRGRQA